MALPCQTTELREIRRIDHNWQMGFAVSQALGGPLSTFCGCLVEKQRSDARRGDETLVNMTPAGRKFRAITRFAAVIFDLTHGAGLVGTLLDLAGHAAAGAAHSRVLVRQ